MFGSLLTLERAVRRRLGGGGDRRLHPAGRPPRRGLRRAGRTTTDMFTRGFMAWFGPKGVATMTFSLLVLAAGPRRRRAPLQPRAPWRSSSRSWPTASPTRRARTGSPGAASARRPRRPSPPQRERSSARGSGVQRGLVLGAGEGPAGTRARLGAEGEAQLARRGQAVGRLRAGRSRRARPGPGRTGRGSGRSSPRSVTFRAVVSALRHLLLAPSSSCRVSSGARSKHGAPRVPQGVRRTPVPQMPDDSPGRPAELARDARPYPDAICESWSPAPRATSGPR